jgi:hypothetical protein
MVLDLLTKSSIRARAEEHQGTRDKLLRALICIAGLEIMAGCTVPAYVTGLEPEYPPAAYAAICFSVLPGDSPVYPDRGGCPVYPVVANLQPTLRWKYFPRGEEVLADHAGMLSRVSAVSYDLKIWKAIEGYLIRRIHRDRSTDPGELVYSRTGLPEPSHTLETPLEPSTRYFWTVRARFKINGHSRVTEWGEQIHVMETLFKPRIVSYYRFETPSE